MKYIITGASGFLGRFIIEAAQGKEVIKIGRGNGNDVVWDLSNPFKGGKISGNILIHAAGHAHTYPKTKEQEEEFFKINYQGTINLLNAIDPSALKQIILISTVAVYGLEAGIDISEAYEAHPNTPYGKSKKMAEDAFLNWGEENCIKVLILRLPLIVGTSPPGNLGKMIKSIRAGRYLSINKGRAKRSAVLATDVAEFLLSGKTMSGIYNLTDNLNPSFRDFEAEICSQLGKPRPISLPLWFLKALGFIGDFLPFIPVNSNLVNKMTLNFTVSTQRAITELNWCPRSVIANFKIEK